MRAKPEPQATLESPLCRIAALTEQIRELTGAQDLAVARARASGATWAEIARALGCSAQAANKRYRWVRHSDHPPQVWFERPLPISPCAAAGSAPRASSRRAFPCRTSATRSRRCGAIPPA